MCECRATAACLINRRHKRTGSAPSGVAPGLRMPANDQHGERPTTSAGLRSGGTARCCQELYNQRLFPPQNMIPAEHYWLKTGAPSTDCREDSAGRNGGAGHQGAVQRAVESTFAGAFAAGCGHFLRDGWVSVTPQCGDVRRLHDGPRMTSDIVRAKAVSAMQACAVHLCHRSPRRGTRRPAKFFLPQFATRKRWASESFLHTSGMRN